MRRNWAAAVLVVSVSVLCAPALAGSARPPLKKGPLSPGRLLITSKTLHPLAPPTLGHRLIEDTLPCVSSKQGWATQHLQPRTKARFVKEQSLSRERVRLAHKSGRLQFGGLALRRPRPGQIRRPTEMAGGQDIHVRAGISYRLAPHFDLTSDLLYIQPAVQSLYVRRARAPIQVGVGTRVTTAKASVFFSFGAGMAEWGGALQPGFFMSLGPGSI